MRSIRQRMEDKAAETGKTSPLLRVARANERSLADRKQPWLRELAIDGRTLRTGDGVHDLAGATARVETTGEIERRVTAARLVGMGVLAFAAKKRRDDRALYLSVEGPHVSVVREYNAKQVDETALRQFAADINQAAAR